MPSFEVKTVEFTLDVAAITAKAENTEPLKGSILYRIPSKMTVGEDIKCTVRIAHDEVILARDFEVDEETTVQAIRVSEVMEVVFLDTNETPVFDIKAVSDTEQFIAEDNFTQWDILVRPLSIGKQELILKINFIDEVDGKERKKELVLEKEIEIEPNKDAESAKTEAQKQVKDLIGKAKTGA